MRGHREDTAPTRRRQRASEPQPPKAARARTQAALRREIVELHRRLLRLDAIYDVRTLLRWRPADDLVAIRDALRVLIETLHLERIP